MLIKDDDVEYDFENENDFRLYCSDGKMTGEVTERDLRPERMAREQAEKLKLEEEQIKQAKIAEAEAVEKKKIADEDSRGVMSKQWENGGAFYSLRLAAEDKDFNLRTEKRFTNTANESTARRAGPTLTFLAQMFREEMMREMPLCMEETDKDAEGNVVIVCGVVRHEGQNLLLVAANGGVNARTGLDILKDVIKQIGNSGRLPFDQIIPLIDAPEPTGKAADRVQNSGKDQDRIVTASAWHGEQKLAAYAKQLGIKTRESLQVLGIAHPKGPCNAKTTDAPQYCDKYLDEKTRQGKKDKVKPNKGEYKPLRTLAAYWDPKAFGFKYGLNDLERAQNNLRERDRGVIISNSDYRGSNSTSSHNNNPSRKRSKSETTITNSNNNNNNNNYQPTSSFSTGDSSVKRFKEDKK